MAEPFLLICSMSEPYLLKHISFLRCARLQLMKVIVDLCLVPVGVGVSLSPYIAECQRILERRGLGTSLHAYGTNIEGPWDEVMAAIKECHEAVHSMGAPRINTTIKLGTRTDRQQTMQDKVASVRDKL